MRKRKLSMVRAAAVGAAALSATLIVGGGVASASIPSDPPGGATPVPPHFYNGNVEGIRDTGSDTTFFMMQKIGDLYTGAGLYGCTLNTSAGQTLYNSSDPASSTTNEEFFCQSGQNISTTDVNDNWDRTEVTQGVDDVGSGAGQSQLCAALSTPLNVDFARSSKPAGTACSTMVETGYAKDGVPILAYPVNPTVYGTSSTSPYSGINGGVVGPVSEGWLPGDPNSGPYTGTAFTNISNADNGGGASSTAYRIWCATGTTRISDWGALTNLGPDIVIPGASVTSGSTTVTLASAVFSSVASGQTITGPDIPSGTTISSIGGGGTLTLSAGRHGHQGQREPQGQHRHHVGRGQRCADRRPDPTLGREHGVGHGGDLSLYAESGVASGGCSSNMNTNSPSDPNPVTDVGDNTSAHVALENNSDQLDQFAITDFPSPDYVDQAIEVATTLYIESNGVYNTNPYAAASTIDGTSYSGTKVEENSQSPTTSTMLTNHYPTARTLFNIYNTNTVRASAGGFINWLCDSNTNFGKGLDNTTGLNFDSELTTAISTTFGFPRLTDESAAPAIGTPADNQPAPNNTCAASVAVSTTAGSNQITITAGGQLPRRHRERRGLVGGASVGVSNANVPSGTTVTSGAGTSTLTLSKNATATGTSVATVFAGVPAVTTVASSQN